MKRLVYINQVANYLAEDIVLAMLNNGGYDEVVMIVGNPENLKISDTRVSIKKIHKYDRTSFVTRAKSWIIATIQILLILTFFYRGAEIFFVSNPPTNVFTTLFTLKKYRSLIYDIYPDALVADGFVSKNNFVIKIWAHVNRIFFRRAERIYTITDGMAEKISQYINRDKIEVVPLWCNPQIRHIERKNNQFLKNHNLEDKFIIMYSGNIGKGHNVDVIPEIALKLKEIKQIQFIIIGDGWEKPSIVKRVEELNLKNVLFLPFQPKDRLSDSLSAADLCFVSVAPNDASLSMPSKTYNCLAAGAGILCSAPSDSMLTKLVKDNNAGVSFEPGDIHIASKLISDLISNAELVNKMHLNALNLAKRYTSVNAVKFL